MRTAHDQELADTSLATRPSLSQQQTEFLRAFAALPFASIHALCKQVGIRSSQVSYWKKHSPEFKKAIMAEYARSQQVVSMSRRRVMYGILDAIDLAKDMRQPSGMITGWKEIGRMCGFYEPERREVKLSVDSQQLMKDLQTMPREKLLELLHEPIEAEFEVVNAS